MNNKILKYLDSFRKIKANGDLKISLLRINIFIFNQEQELWLKVNQKMSLKKLKIRQWPCFKQKNFPKNFNGLDY